MKPTTAKIQLLIKELLTKALIDHPSALTFEPREGGAGVYWQLQVHADDYRKVCGTGGAHIKALTFLIAEMGDRVDEEHKLWLKESVVGEKQPMKPVDPVDSYDPREARDLLCRMLEALLGNGAAFSVEVHADGSRIETPPFSLLYTFTIVVGNDEDERRLTSSYEDDAEDRTIEECLAEIWRAYAVKHGVAFALKVTVNPAVK